MTVVKNEKNKLIPQRTITSWHMCRDYQKLNKATKKDHFLLPFIDEMLEWLANHSFLLFSWWIFRVSPNPNPLLHVHMELMLIEEYLLGYVMLQLLFKDITPQVFGLHLCICIASHEHIHSIITFVSSYVSMLQYDVSLVLVCVYHMWCPYDYT
jgi:hypothetical protein